MTYERYKTIKTKQEFFDEWDSESLESLTPELRERIYQKYVLKAAVLQRDGFTCQNEDCPYCNNEREAPDLTMHHVKFKKNNGEDKLKNCVTICRPAHKGFHRGKNGLTFWGATYRIHKDEKVNWKKVRAKTRQIRANCKHEHCVKISPELMRLLIQFLFRNINMDYEDDV